MDITIKISGQHLKTDANLNGITLENINFIRIKFDLSDDWENLKCFAQFKQGRTIYDQYLDENNSVTLPINISEGEWSISLYGKDDKVVATSDSLTMVVIPSPIDLTSDNRSLRERTDQLEREFFNFTNGYKEVLGKLYRGYSMNTSGVISLSPSSPNSNIWQFPVEKQKTYTIHFENGNYRRYGFGNEDISDGLQLETYEGKKPAQEEETVEYTITNMQDCKYLYVYNSSNDQKTNYVKGIVSLDCIQNYYAVKADTDITAERLDEISGWENLREKPLTLDRVKLLNSDSSIEWLDDSTAVKDGLTFKFEYDNDKLVSVNMSGNSAQGTFTTMICSETYNLKSGTTICFSGCPDDGDFKGYMLALYKQGSKKKWLSADYGNGDYYTVKEDGKYVLRILYKNLSNDTDEDTQKDISVTFTPKISFTPFESLQQQINQNEENRRLVIGAWNIGEFTCGYRNKDDELTYGYTGNPIYVDKSGGYYKQSKDENVYNYYDAYSNLTEKTFSKEDVEKLIASGKVTKKTDTPLQAIEFRKIISSMNADVFGITESTKYFPTDDEIDILLTEMGYENPQDMDDYEELKQQFSSHNYLYSHLFDYEVTYSKPNAVKLGGQKTLLTNKPLKAYGYKAFKKQNSELKKSNGFQYGVIKFGNREVLLVVVHFANSVNNVKYRAEEMKILTDYCADYDNVIVMGDMNLHRLYEYELWAMGGADVITVNSDNVPTGKVNENAEITFTNTTNGNTLTVVNDDEKGCVGTIKTKSINPIWNNGNGSSWGYVSSQISGFPLDNISVKGNIRIRHFGIHQKTDLSDHYPVYAVVDFI